MAATVAGIHLGPDTHANRPAANAAGLPVGSLYSCSDHGLIYITDGSSWSTWATLGETGAAAHIADSSDAHDASAISIADSGGYFTGTDVEAALQELGAAGGGGGLTQAYVGTNSVGGSLETLVTRKWLLKSVVLANACLITDIEASIKASADKVDNFIVALFADNAGSPKELLALGGEPTASTVMALTTVVGAGTARWLGRAIGYWAAAGTYWLGVSAGTDTDIGLQIAYATSGSDRYFTTGGTWVTDAGYTTVSTGTNDYSIRANTIR